MHISTSDLQSVWITFDVAFASSRQQSDSPFLRRKSRVTTTANHSFPPRLHKAVERTPIPSGVGLCVHSKSLSTAFSTGVNNRGSELAKTAQSAAVKGLGRIRQQFQRGRSCTACPPPGLRRPPEFAGSCGVAPSARFASRIERTRCTFIRKQPERLMKSW
jgi:hypothetical protein